MTNKIFNSDTTIPFGLDIIRIVSGLIIISFGLELFDSEKMAGNTEWTTDVKIPYAPVMVYVGKISELCCGMLLVLGLWTRMASIPLILTMFTITFIMLDGSVRTGSFYLLMLFAVYFFKGSGTLSVDTWLKNKSVEAQ